MREMKIMALFVLLTVCGATMAWAQAPQDRQAWLDRYRNLGVGLTTTFPFQEFGDEYETGYGLHLLADYPLIPLLNFTAGAGYTHFGRINEGDGLGVLGLVFGGKIVFGPAFMGGETGYYTQVDDWSWVPTFGLRFQDFEFSLRYKTNGSGTWTTLRAGYYF